MIKGYGENKGGKVAEEIHNFKDRDKLSSSFAKNFDFRLLKKARRLLSVVDSISEPE